MKPFLGVDLTTDKKNEQPNGDIFIVQKPSLALTESLESCSENVEQAIEKSKLPLPVRIVQWVCGAVAVLIASGIASALVDEDAVSLSQAYQNASWLFWLGGACLVLWAFLFVIGLKKQHHVLGTDESELAFDNFDRSCDTILAQLNVPADSKEIDVLSFFYKTKGDDIKVCEKGMQIAPYLNPIFHAFSDSENLYLANLEAKYAIPLSAIKAIRSVKKTIRIEEWNKDEAYNKGIYKPYKLSEDDYGCIHCKTYHIVEFEHDNESWGIYIPCYELPVIEALTGLAAEAF